jgi:DNA-directed RNA polymerase specialized sigma24 family protein
MTQDADGTRATLSIAPLRKRKLDGSEYHRRPEVEEALALLLQLPTSEVVRRASIVETDHSDYVPTECVLYFVRRLDSRDDEEALHDLFKILRQRVLKAVPVFRQRIAGSDKLGLRAFDVDLRELVLHNFQALLCRDRREYDATLDFYECQFNQALARLRSTARRDLSKEEAHYKPVASNGESDGPYENVEAALTALREQTEENGRARYRSSLHVAISSLPQDERRVIELILRGLPIDSIDDNVLTIAKVLKCTEKTVRNRRDRALTKLRHALTEEDDT